MSPEMRGELYQEICELISKPGFNHIQLLNLSNKHGITEVQFILNTIEEDRLLGLEMADV